MDYDHDGHSPDSDSDSENIQPHPLAEENQCPQIISSPGELSAFRVILAPRPPPPPTRTELKSAKRCMLSGMVPGAIRKYLMQKKKHEVDIDGEDSGSAAPSPNPDPHDRERERLQGHGHGRSGSNGDSTDDDDEIQCVGEFNLKNGLHLNGEDVTIVSGKPGPVVGIVADPDPDPDDENPENGDAINDALHSDHEEAETETENQTNQRQRNRDANATSTGTGTGNKRMFREAFNFSPDSTTPDLKHSEKKKRLRLEKTPSKNNGDCNSTSTSTSESEGNAGRRMAPGPPPIHHHQRKRERGRMSTSSSGVEDSPRSSPRGDRQGKRHSWVRQVLQEPVVHSVVIAADDEWLEKCIKKNDWKNVVEKMQTNLGQTPPALPIIPQAKHLGDLIRRAILCIGSRVAKDIPTMAVEFFNNLVAKYPVHNEDSTNYYMEAFTQSSSDVCTMTEFLFVVIKTIQADAQAKVPPKAFPFFKTLTKMVVNQYKEYERSAVKLRPPFVVRFIEEQDKVVSYNAYCAELLQFVFKLLDYPDELKAVMRWVGLLAHHLRVHNNLDSQLQMLVDDFTKHVSKPEYANSKITIIQSISDKDFGASVCLKLLQRSMEFECVGADFDSDEDGRKPTEKEITAFFEEISKSERIAGLKSQLREQHRTEDLGPPVVSSFIGIGGKKKRKEGVNMKGETHLHLLCRKESSTSKKSLDLECLEKILKGKYESVNPTDNFGNTPLMDVIAHGRFDALTKFAEYCADPTLPEYLRVNLLAQNDAGETSFHLAAVAKEKGLEMIQILLCMSEKLQVTDEVLKTLNGQGKMPFELAFTPEVRSKLRPIGIVDLPSEWGNVRVRSSSRAELESPEIRRLIALWSEFSSKNE